MTIKKAWCRVLIQIIYLCVTSPKRWAFFKVIYAREGNLDWVMCRCNGNIRYYYILTKKLSLHNKHHILLRFNAWFLYSQISSPIQTSHILLDSFNVSFLYSSPIRYLTAYNSHWTTAKNSGVWPSLPWKRKRNEGSYEWSWADTQSQRRRED